VLARPTASSVTSKSNKFMNNETPNPTKPARFKVIYNRTSKVHAAICVIDTRYNTLAWQVPGSTREEAEAECERLNAANETDVAATVQATKTTEGAAMARFEELLNSYKEAIEGVQIEYAVGTVMGDEEEAIKTAGLATDALRAFVAGLVRDGERLDWLKSHTYVQAANLNKTYLQFSVPVANNLRESIDDAMQEARK